MKKILVANIGWMSAYKGLDKRPDNIVGGGAHVDTCGHGHECCNFLPCEDGYIYGHVETIRGETDTRIALERIGGTRGADVVQGIDVVWTATHPQERGRRVIGWYRNADVYRSRQKFKDFPSAQHKADRVDTFIIRTKLGNETLLPLEARTLKLSDGPGWIGQKNWWYPLESKNQEVNSFIQKLQNLMLYSPYSAQENKKGWGRGNRDPNRNAEVERIAINFVKNYFSDFVVKSVEDENCGWDLEIYDKGNIIYKIEVKGISSENMMFGLTPNEYRKFLSHQAGQNQNYRIAVVCNALGKKPRGVILKYDAEKIFGLMN